MTSIYLSSLHGIPTSLKPYAMLRRRVQIHTLFSWVSWIELGRLYFALWLYLVSLVGECPRRSLRSRIPPPVLILTPLLERPLMALPGRLGSLGRPWVTHIRANGQTIEVCGVIRSRWISPPVGRGLPPVC